MAKLIRRTQIFSDLFLHIYLVSHYSLNTAHSNQPTNPLGLFLSLHFEVLCHENNCDSMLLSSVSCQSEVVQQKRGIPFLLCENSQQRNMNLQYLHSASQAVWALTHTVCLTAAEQTTLFPFNTGSQITHSLLGEGGRELKLYQQRMCLMNFSPDCLIKNVNVCMYNGAILTKEQARLSGKDGRLDGVVSL